MEWLGYPPVGSHRGLDLSSLPLNHAWVTVNSSVDNLGVYSMDNDCFNCPYKLVGHIRANVADQWQVNTSTLVSWRIVRTSDPADYMSNHNRQGWLCEMRPTFHEYGVYRLNVGKCEVKPEVPPVHTYYPLLLSSSILLLIYLLYTILQYTWRSKRKNGDKQEKVLQINEENHEDRLQSLHVFRGFILSLIIFTTTGGGGYPIFNNSWGGLTIAEFLYFMFMWSIGLHVPTVMDQTAKQHGKCKVLRDIFVRAFLLMFLGTVIDSTVESRPWTIPLWCPLQRLGLAYFVVAAAYVLTVQRFEMKSKMIICKAISDLIALMWCWIVAGFLLSIIVISISTLLSFNCLGNIGLEVQRADYSDVITEVTQNCNNNITEYANRMFVGEVVKMANVNGYIGIKGGALGIMSSILYMLIGLKGGVVYLNHTSHADRIKLWILWATLFGFGGTCVAIISYPLDFNLWPIASVLIISAFSFYIYSLIYLITKVYNLTNRVLYSTGVTSLVILSGHLLFSNSLPFNWQIEFNNHLFYLLQNYWIVLLWLISGVTLYKRDIKFDI